MSVLNLNPKVADKTKSAAPSHKSAEEAEIAPSDEPLTSARIEQALQLFSSQAERIPGVLRIRRYRIGRLNEEGVMVVVANLFSPVTHDVIRAQERVYDAMPGIRFTLDIKDASALEHSEP